MLQLTNKALLAEAPRGEEVSPAETFQRIVGVLRRQIWIIVSVMAVCLSLGVTYLLVTPPRFTAQATMVIDTSHENVFQQQAIVNDAVIDSTAVETQVEVLKSNNVVLGVIKKFDLIHDPEFVGPSTSPISRIIGAILTLFSSDGPPSEYELTQTALASFQKMATIKRSGMTYVIDISFTSLSPDRAAQIANAIADGYVDEQMEARYQATKRAGAYLQGRLEKLRADALNAEKSVQNFKDQNNIVDSGGRLMSEQQLAEVNSQLVAARAQSAEAKARLDRIQEVIRDDGTVPGAAVADMLHSDVINKLRSQYLDLSNRKAIWAAQFGKAHMAVVNLGNQMEEIRHSIFDELKRIGGTYKSDYEIARAREQSMQASLDSAVTESQATSQASVQLRELQSNSQTYRSLYDSFLQRYVEATQQQSFPITRARVISPAAPPLKKSLPSTIIVAAATLLAAAFAGAGAAYARELGDRVFRTSAQIETILQTPCVATLPKVQARKNVSGPDHVRGLDDRRKLNGTGILAYAVEEPESRFTESLRAIKVSFDLARISRSVGNKSGNSGNVIAFTSTLPQEGKSTAAANFARHLAHAGNRVIMIDADFRHPALSNQLTNKPRLGLLQVLAGQCHLGDAICVDPLTGLVFLPVGPNELALSRANSLLGSAKMKQFVEAIRAAYDCVVVDLPPLAPIVDVQTTAAFVDFYVYIVEWGRTKIDVVAHHLNRAANVHDRLLGVVLNKANVKQLDRYESYYGLSQYTRHSNQLG